eukprot:948575-Prorocentrum_minimum.AAC.1
MTIVNIIGSRAHLLDLHEQAPLVCPHGPGCDPHHPPQPLLTGPLPAPVRLQPRHRRPDHLRGVTGGHQGGPESTGGGPAFGGGSRSIFKVCCISDDQRRRLRAPTLNY